MIDTLLEAVAATGQRCSFVLIAPPVLAAIVLRAAWASVIATFAAAIAGGWLLAAGVFVLDGWPMRISGVVVAAVLGIALARSFTDRPPSPATHAANGAIAGGVTLIASMWWRPCVGIEFGRLLTAAQTEPVAPLPGLAVYMIGTMLPVLAVALAWRTLAPSARVSRGAAIAAAGGASAIALALVLGHPDAVSPGWA